jgi:AcrR family transcriptional regulator
MTDSTDAPAETRERILDAAEALFGEQGFDAVSLRDITGRAGANVAAVNYHFGSKEKLIDAVVIRHAVPINDGRLRLLLEAEERHGGQPVPLREILDAFLRPVIDEILRDPVSEAVFCKFMGRIMSEQGYQLPETVRPLFQMMAGRFSQALQKARPELSEQTALWRMHFSFGVMSNTLMHRDKLEQISGGRSGNPGMEELLNHIIDFCVAGFQAPEQEEVRT